MVPIVVTLFRIFIFLRFGSQFDAFLCLTALFVTFRISTAMKVRTAARAIRGIPVSIYIYLLFRSVVTIAIPEFTFVTFSLF